MQTLFMASRKGSAGERRGGRAESPEGDASVKDEEGSSFPECFRARNAFASASPSVDDFEGPEEGAFQKSVLPHVPSF